jgi:hypothetical protein
MKNAATVHQEVERMRGKYLDNQSRPLKCVANGYKPRPPNPLFFSDILNLKWEKKQKDWDGVWAKYHF